MGGTHTSQGERARSYVIFHTHTRNVATHTHQKKTGTLNERLTKERQSIRRVASKRAAALDARDKERAMILSQASEKYENLEKELRRALEEVERRERALRNERSVMMSEVKEKMDALKAEERRLGMDVEQRKQLERDRVQDFVQRLRNAEAQRVAAEKRLVEIECEFAEFRREVRRLVVDSFTFTPTLEHRYEVHPWQRSRQILWNVERNSRESVKISRLRDENMSRRNVT